jgi:hypothetical protein
MEYWFYLKTKNKRLFFDGERELYHKIFFCIKNDFMCLRENRKLKKKEIIDIQKKLMNEVEECLLIKSRRRARTNLNPSEQVIFCEKIIELNMTDNLDRHINFLIHFYNEISISFEISLNFGVCSKI